MTKETGDEIKLVTLANGAEEALPVVATTMLSLERIIDSNPIAFYELVMKCRDQGHRFFGNTQEVLSDFALVQPEGTVHESIRNVVLSAVNGEDLNMTLGSPYLTQAKA